MVARSQNRPRLLIALRFCNPACRQGTAPRSPSLPLGAFSQTKSSLCKEKENENAQFVFALDGRRAPECAALMAQNIKLSGPHYNLNIIGVENPKKSSLQDTSRHTIFVALGTNQGGAVYR
jgi:hypothetical protein